MNQENYNNQNSLQSLQNSIEYFTNLAPPFQQQYSTAVGFLENGVIEDCIPAQELLTKMKKVEAAIKPIKPVQLPSFINYFTDIVKPFQEQYSTAVGFYENGEMFNYVPALELLKDMRKAQTAIIKHKMEIDLVDPCLDSITDDDGYIEY